jgi:hypothetical protein
VDTILTSVIAVLGTLLGSVVAHAFQQRSTRHAQQHERAERRREERLTAFGTYAGLLVDFRQAMLHHWFCVHEGKDAEQETTLRARSFELRSDTQHALFQLQLLVEEPDLTAAAITAFTEIGKLDRPTRRADLITRRDTTRALIDDFVRAARQYT